MSKLAISAHGVKEETMRAIKKIASGCTVKSLRNDIFATVGAWLACVAAGGAYWLLVRHEGVYELWFGASVIVGIKLLIDGVLLAAVKKS